MPNVNGNELVLDAWCVLQCLLKSVVGIIGPQGLSMYSMTWEGQTSRNRVAQCQVLDEDRQQEKKDVMLDASELGPNFEASGPNPTHKPHLAIRLDDLVRKQPSNLIGHLQDEYSVKAQTSETCVCTMQKPKAQM